MTIVTIAGTKGGSSKTTTTCLLAMEAVSRGRSVLLLDLDPQGTATAWLPEISQYQPDLTTDGIRALAAGYDLTLIDTPPGADTRAIVAIESADLVIAVTALGAGDLAGLMDLVRVVDPDLIVPTRRDGRRVLHAQALDAIQRQFPGIVTTAIPSSAGVERAQATHSGLHYNARAALAYRDVYNRLTKLEKS